MSPDPRRPHPADADRIPFRPAPPGAVETGLRRLGRGLVRAGLPPAWLDWHAVVSEAPLARPGDPRVKILEPPERATAPLPRNVDSRAQLSADRGWWGFSRRDVTDRAVAPTSLVRIEDATIVAFRSAEKSDYEVGLLDGRGRAIHLPQIRFGPRHAEVLRRRPPVRHVARALWIAERCYDNHSHWLTAHLPKLLFLAERDMLANLTFPAERGVTIDASLATLDLDPGDWTAMAPMTALKVGALDVLVTDRFRPSLLTALRAAHLPCAPPPRRRRILVSRQRARGRRLLGEDALWPRLEARGFEQVELERLDYAAQVRLMQEAAVMVAPHGAGLTNMVFAPPGLHVVEIADTGYPNPNFYALAAAMGHPYWLIEAEGVGAGHPLDRDLKVAPEAVLSVVVRIEAGAG